MNSIKTYHFNIDLLREIYSPLIYLVRSDTYTNRLVIRLLNDGVIIEPKSYDIITLTVKKPDNTTCISTGEYKNGVVVFDLDFQNVAVEGLCSCVIKVVSGDKSVTSMPFAYKVVNDPYEGTDKSIQSQSEFPVLNDLIKNVSGAIKELQNVETFYRNNEIKFRNLADNYDILKSIYENKEEARELINSLQGLKKSIDGADEKQRNLEALIDRANKLVGKITDNTVKMIDLISETDKKLTKGESVVKELQQALQNYENIRTEINSITDSINSLKKLLSDVNNTINTANTTKDSLNKSVGEANEAKTNLDQSTKTAETANTVLTNSINASNIAKADLDNSRKEADRLKIDIGRVVNTANATKTAIDESTATANSINANLNSTVQGASTTKTDLEKLLQDLNLTKGQVQEIIASGNLDQYVTDVKLQNELKAYVTKEDLQSIDVTSQLGGYAKKTEVPTKLSELENDTTFKTETEIQTMINAHTPDLTGYVEKVQGKGLSTNDYTNADKAKVDNIPLNPKYTDTTYEIATQSSSGLMSATDKVKVNNIPASPKYTDTVTTINGKTGAISKADITALGMPAQDSVYDDRAIKADIAKKADKTELPTKLSQLAEDSTHRTVTDTEKSTWNNKQDRMTKESVKALGFPEHVVLTQAQYDALSSTQKADATVFYYIKK